MLSHRLFMTTYPLYWVYHNLTFLLDIDNKAFSVCVCVGICEFVYKKPSCFLKVVKQLVNIPGISPHWVLFTPWEVHVIIPTLHIKKLSHG